MPKPLLNRGDIGIVRESVRCRCAAALSGTKRILSRLPLMRKCMTPWRLCRSFTLKPQSSSRFLEKVEKLQASLIAYATQDAGGLEIADFHAAQRGNYERRQGEGENS
jgi:hypothetical protein